MTGPGASPRPSPEAMRAVKAAVAEVIRGKDEVIELVLVALCAGGHVLLEDLPGVGKSTLARAVATAVGAELSRIQFTADLLPADIIGVSVWRPQAERFEFRPGPVFAHFVLADEINRAPPRTQSALLEAMGEAQVSVEGQPRPLPQPFMVIATQNPSEHHGTYPLPESQRDRFALRITLGYASAAIEAELLQSGATTGAGRTAGKPVTTLAQVELAQTAAAGLYLHPDLAAYAQRVVQATREHGELAQGVSTRGALAWVATARARAWLEGREQVSIDDLQALAVPTLAHRVVLRSGELADAVAAEHVRDIIARTPVPR